MTKIVTAKLTIAECLTVSGTKYLTNVIPFNREKSYRLFHFIWGIWSIEIQKLAPVRRHGFTEQLQGTISHKMWWCFLEYHSSNWDDGERLSSHLTLGSLAINKTVAVSWSQNLIKADNQILRSSMYAKMSWEKNQLAYVTETI